VLQIFGKISRLANNQKFTEFFMERWAVIFAKVVHLVELRRLEYLIKFEKDGVIEPGRVFRHKFRNTVIVF
jgi:hypothetical protein